MTKLEELNKQIRIVSTSIMMHKITMKDNIYHLYLNDKQVLCGKEAIIDDLIHGYIIGYFNGIQATYRSNII